MPIDAKMEYTIPTPIFSAFIINRTGYLHFCMKKSYSVSSFSGRAVAAFARTHLSSRHSRGFTRLNFSDKNSRGFTLIELLVVIPIIGLLSSVVFASLNAARVKGRIAAAQGSMKNAQLAAMICLDDNVATLNAPNTVPPQPVCAGSASTWPTLPSASWSWSVNNLNSSAFSFSAIGDGKTITCTTNGCITAP